MSNFASNLAVLTVWFSRFIRGLILILWILVLVVVAFGSLNGNIADSLMSFRFGFGGNYNFSTEINQFGQGIFLEGNEKNTVRRNCPNGRDQFMRPSNFLEYPPPVDAVLDVILPNWANALSKGDGLCTEDQAREFSADYSRLRTKVADRLWSVARDEKADTKGEVIDATIIPPNFRNTVTAFETAAVKLPPEVQEWMTQERGRIKKDSQARSLLGTFLLLSVLGAFGALIFLIRDYTSSVVEKKLSVYIFRPVLGIFLAMAVFIVDILAHSVISTASILEIRYEPLYILALGAGLLSERAYDAIRGRADSALEQYANDSSVKKKVKLNQENTGSGGD